MCMTPAAAKLKLHTSEVDRPGVLSKSVFCRPPQRWRPTGSVIGGAGDEKAQHGEQASLLSPTAEEAASAGDVFGGVGDEHPSIVDEFIFCRQPLRRRPRLGT